MDIVLFDTETTGLLLPDNTPIKDQPKIIEFFGTRINEDFKIIDEFETFVYPGEPITQEITQITGIKNSDIEDAPVFKDVAKNIYDLIDGADLCIAHNIAFDNGMLLVEFNRIGQTRPLAARDLCTVEYLKDQWGYRISLGGLYNKLFSKAFKAHRAKNDVYALVTCLHKLIEDEVIDLAIYKN